MRALILAVFVVPSAALLSSTTDGVTPVTKVIQLLQSMAEKGKAEKHTEAIQFATYQQWCDDTQAEKQRSIAAANSEIEQLDASIQMDQARGADLGREITEVDGQTAVWEADKKAATQVRDREHADYLLSHKDYTESLDALDRAVNVLRQQSFNRKQAGDSLAQVQSLEKLPTEVSRVITAFLAQGDTVEQDPLSVSAPEANGYEFQSGGVVEMLVKLKEKFADERTDLEKEEMNARHSFEMLSQDLVAQMKQANGERTRKASEKAQVLEGAAAAKGSLTDTTATRDNDSHFLRDTTSACQIKASDFASRQQLRQEELDAIAKAVEIMSGGSVAGHAATHLPSFVQLSAFLSGRGRSPQERVAQFLKARGEKAHSNVLLTIAARADNDPFEKVRKMIKDLIVRLMEEANEESEHKGWCDTELATNLQTRNSKTAQVDTLTSGVEELHAAIAKLGQEITDTSVEMQELAASVATATEQRQKDKAIAVQTISEAKEAQMAVSQAVEVLKEFYAKAADSTSFFQGAQAQPEIFTAPYTGMQSSTGGVVGMLEVIQADFARLESETDASESEAQAAFDKFNNEAAVNRAQLAKDSEHLLHKKTQTESDLNEKENDLKGSQQELDAALSYYEKLKPSCVDAGVTYEDRVGRRKEEIESLQEALRILNGDDIA